MTKYRLNQITAYSASIPRNEAMAPFGKNGSFTGFLLGETGRESARKCIAKWREAKRFRSLPAHFQGGSPRPRLPHPRASRILCWGVTVLGCHALWSLVGDSGSMVCNFFNRVRFIGGRASSRV